MNRLFGVVSLGVALLLNQCAGAEPDNAPKQRLTPEQLKSPDFRKWTDVSGKYSVQALYREIVRIEGDEFPKDMAVRLTKEDGTTVQLPVVKLSPADGKWLRSRNEPKGSKKPKGYTMKKVNGEWVKVEVSEEELKAKADGSKAQKEAKPSTANEKTRNKFLEWASSLTKPLPKTSTPGAGSYLYKNMMKAGARGELLGHAFRSVQIIDGNNLLAEIVTDHQGGSPTLVWGRDFNQAALTKDIVWLKNSTKDMVDDTLYEDKHVYEVVGTKQYSTLAGTRTVYLLEQK